MKCANSLAIFLPIYTETLISCSPIKSINFGQLLIGTLLRASFTSNGNKFFKETELCLTYLKDHSFFGKEARTKKFVVLRKGNYLNKFEQLGQLSLSLFFG